MEELSFLQLGLEMTYSIFWVLFLMAVFHPKWAPEKSYQYKSRKFRLSVVLMGIVTAFYALGKISTFETYAVCIFAIYSTVTGANVLQKYLLSKSGELGSLADSNKTQE